jgi:hypothetical protein
MKFTIIVVLDHTLQVQLKTDPYQPLNKSFTDTSRIKQELLLERRLQENVIQIFNSLIAIATF